MRNIDSVVSVLPRIAPFGFGDSPVHSDQSAQVTCLVSEGDAPLNITWRFQGRRIDTDAQASIYVNPIGSKASVLLIDKVHATLSGNYTCVAQNRAGSAQYTASLFVYGSVRFVSLFSRIARHSFFFCVFFWSVQLNFEVQDFY